MTRVLISGVRTTIVILAKRMILGILEYKYLPNTE